MVDRQHRYKVGQTVELLPSTLRSAAPGPYGIVHLVPCDGNDPRYRLKSDLEKYERIMPECELIPPVPGA